MVQASSSRRHLACLVLLLVACSSWEPGEVFTPTEDEHGLGVRISRWRPMQTQAAAVAYSGDTLYVGLSEVATGPSGGYRVRVFAVDSADHSTELPRPPRCDYPGARLFGGGADSGVLLLCASTGMGELFWYDGSQWWTVPLPRRTDSNDLRLWLQDGWSIVGRTRWEIIYWNGLYWHALKRLTSEADEIEVGPWAEGRLKILSRNRDGLTVEEFDTDTLRRGPSFSMVTGEGTRLASGALNGTPDDFHVGLRLPSLAANKVRLVRVQGGTFTSGRDVPGLRLLDTPGSQRLITALGEPLPSSTRSLSEQAQAATVSGLELIEGGEDRGQALEPFTARVPCGEGCTPRALLPLGALRADGRRVALVSLDLRDEVGKVYVRQLDLPHSGPVFGEGGETPERPDGGSPEQPDGGAPNDVAYLQGEIVTSNGETDLVQCTVESADGFGWHRVASLPPAFRVEVEPARAYQVRCSAEGYLPLEFPEVTSGAPGSTFDLKRQVLTQGTVLGTRPVDGQGQLLEYLPFTAFDGTMLVQTKEKWQLVREVDGALQAPPLSVPSQVPVGMAPPVPVFTPDGVLALFPTEPVRVVRVSDGAELPTPGWLTSFGLSPLQYAREGKVGLAGGFGEKILFDWSAEGLTERCRITSTTNRYVFSPAGTRLGVLENRDLAVYDTATCARVVMAQVDSQTRAYDELTPSNDGTWLLFASPAGGMNSSHKRCWDTADGCKLTVFGQGGATTEIGSGLFVHALSSESPTRFAYLAGPEGNGTLALFDVAANGVVGGGGVQPDVNLRKGWVAGDGLVLLDGAGAKVFDLSANTSTTLAGAWAVTPRLDGSLLLEPTVCQDTCERVVLDPRTGAQRRYPKLSTSSSPFARGERVFECVGLRCAELHTGPADGSQMRTVAWGAQSFAVQGDPGFTGLSAFEAPCVLYVRPPGAVLQVGTTGTQVVCVR